MFKSLSKRLCKGSKQSKGECECPVPEPDPGIDYSMTINSADVQPARANPADVMGFASKFCYFIPLKPGAFIICFFSFIWTAAEIMGADKQIADIFPARLRTFQAFKLIYMLLCIGLLLATCALLVGIIQEKYALVNTYIWYACLFTVLFLLVNLAGVICVTVHEGRTPARKGIKLVAVAVWVSLLAYFIVIINSFKYTLW